MAPIKTLHDAALLCKRLANYYQRRINRLQGVGPAFSKREPRGGLDLLLSMAEIRAKRDLASTLYRRFHHGRNGKRG